MRKITQFVMFASYNTHYPTYISMSTLNSAPLYAVNPTTDTVTRMFQVVDGHPNASLPRNETETVQNQTQNDSSAQSDTKRESIASTIRSLYRNADVRHVAAVAFILYAITSRDVLLFVCVMGLIAVVAFVEYSDIGKDIGKDSGESTNSASEGFDPGPSTSSSSSSSSSPSPSPSSLPSASSVSTTTALANSLPVTNLTNLDKTNQPDPTIPYESNQVEVDSASGAKSLNAALESTFARPSASNPLNNDLPGDSTVKDSKGAPPDSDPIVSNAISHAIADIKPNSASSPSATDDGSGGAEATHIENRTFYSQANTPLLMTGDRETLAAQLAMGMVSGKGDDPADIVSRGRRVETHNNL